VRGQILAAPFLPEMVELTACSGGAPQDLARIVADWLQTKLPFSQRDPREVENLVEHELKGPKGSVVDPLRLVEEIAHEFLTERDGVPALRPEIVNAGGMAEASGRLTTWRDLVQRVDPTIFVAASLVRYGVSKNHTTTVLEEPISVGDLLLRRALAPGVVETHLHLAAAHSFHAFLRRFLHPEDRLWRELFKNIHQREIPGLGIGLDRTLGLMLLLRHCLERRLYPSMPVPEDDPLRWDQVLRRFMRAVQDPQLGLRDAIMVIPVNTVQELRTLRASLFPAAEDQPSFTEGDCREQAAPPESLVNETLFLVELLEHMQTYPRQWPPSARHLAATYLRVKNAIYRAVVMEPDRPGFAAFKESLKVLKGLELDGVRALLVAASDPMLERLEVRIRPGGRSPAGFQNAIADLLAVQQLILTQGNLGCDLAPHCAVRQPGDPLALSSRRCCEMALTPVGSPRRRDVCKIAGRSCERVVHSQSDAGLLRLGGHLTRIGIVLHFLKPDRHPSVEGASLWQILREYGKKALVSAVTIREIMEAHPGGLRWKQDRHEDDDVEMIHVAPLSDYVVGIDVANVETALPNMVFLPAFRYLRGAWRLGGQEGRRQSLGFTFHCGEDFFDLISGLRTIEEVMEAFRFLPGDRLGHALAAGLEPEWWCGRREPVMVPLEEEIWNRLWIWRLARDGRVHYPKLSSLESWLIARGQEWLGLPNVLPPHLLALARCRFEAFTGLLLRDAAVATILGEDLRTKELERRQAGHRRRSLTDVPECPEIRRPGEDPVGMSGFQKVVAEALDRYFHDPGVFARGQERILVQRNPEEIALIRDLQRHICELMAERGVFIEANLTSNCVIAGIEDVKDHPIYRWKLPSEDLATGLRVSLNTDNVAVFGTRLETEYALLFDGARRRGVGRTAARELVDTVRRESAAACFVRRRPASRDQELMGLCALLRELRR